MAFTDVGSSAGRIYDDRETSRLDDFANKFIDSAQKIDSNDTKKKDTIRYIIIGVGAILILALLKIAVRKKK
jgi:hypothetical protein